MIYLWLIFGVIVVGSIHLTWLAFKSIDAAAARDRAKKKKKKKHAHA
jgi:threonine/homoserine/homoserine lactone efflux protein